MMDPGYMPTELSPKINKVDEEVGPTVTLGDLPEFLKSVTSNQLLELML